MNIGIVGGTFDPFHRGHLETVLAVREEMEWDRVLYVVAHRQPFKLDRDSAADWHRYAMAVLATLEYQTISVSAVDLTRGSAARRVRTAAMSLFVASRAKNTLTTSSRL